MNTAGEREDGTSRESSIKIAGGELLFNTGIHLIVL